MRPNAARCERAMPGNAFHAAQRTLLRRCPPPSPLVQSDAQVTERVESLSADDSRWKIGRSREVVLTRRDRPARSRRPHSSGPRQTVLWTIDSEEFGGAGNAVKESRLEIPLLFGYDVIHGYKNVFPCRSDGVQSGDRRLDGERPAMAGHMNASVSGINWTLVPWSTSGARLPWGALVEGDALPLWVVHSHPCPTADSVRQPTLPLRRILYSLST